MNLDRYHEIMNDLAPYGARLVAVSKTRPAADLLILYQQGQRSFGENKVQEITTKHEALPQDIDWHLIGHLQTNKVKQIAPFVSMIQSVDSIRLIEEIDRQAERHGRIIPCLLQIHIASEETKFGFERNDLAGLLTSADFLSLQHIQICGLMGMATNTEDTARLNREFAELKAIFDLLKKEYFLDKPYFKELSMGMSSDYKIALDHGATIVRIGSDIFGSRTP